MRRQMILQMIAPMKMFETEIATEIFLCTMRNQMSIPRARFRRFHTNRTETSIRT